MTQSSETTAPESAVAEAEPAAVAGTVPAAAPAEPAPPPKPGHARAVGRRKKSTASVRIMPGKGKMTINGRTPDAYFSDIDNRQECVSPLELSKARDRYDVIVKVSGGGTTGQAGAICLGISRCLAIAEPDLRAALRADTFMTRDARRKERKKYGRRGARRGFQFSKR